LIVKSVQGGLSRFSIERVREWFKKLLRLLPKALYKLRLPLAFLVSAIVLQIMAALFPSIVERFYARPVYPHIASALSFFSRRFRFSVAEALIYLVIAFILFSLARLILQLYLRPIERLKRAGAAARFIAWSMAVCLWAFLLCFGLNYQRPLLFDMLGFERAETPAAQLEAMSGEIISRINENYEEAHASDRAVPEREEIIHFLEESYSATPELAALLPQGSFAKPKPVYFSGVMTRLGISGIYFPFTAEANYNAEQPDFQLPFTVAHEMAHQRGVARESEANFVAFLVCINSTEPFIRYSGYRNALGVLTELFRKEPERARELVRQLGPGFREDSRRAALFWARAKGLIGNIGARINDLYLRANRVQSGTADYAASTTLIIGYYRKRLESYSE
jgi:hypothetical protein